MCQKREMGQMGCLKTWAGPFITPASFFSPFSFLFFLILLLYPAVLSTGKVSPRLTALKTLVAAVTGGTLVIYYWWCHKQNYMHVDKFKVTLFCGWYADEEMIVMMYWWDDSSINFAKRGGFEDANSKLSMDIPVLALSVSKVAMPLPNSLCTVLS